MEETGSPLSVAIEPAVLHLGAGACGISPTHINISIEPTEEYKKRKEKKSCLRQWEKLAKSLVGKVYSQATHDAISSVH